MSGTWTSGYVGDTSYTLGFYRELAPTFLNFCALMNGVEAPPLTKPLRYCELGCGRGYGTTLLAAANPNFEFVGIDFNPSHIAEARSLATRAKIPNVTFVEASFGDAAASSDPKLSDFDIIAVHGVYTWVERAVRNDICQFIRRKLLAGGLVYNSYNVLPGWATAMPIQHILMEVANRSSKDSVSALKEGYTVLRTLLDKSSGFVTQSPGVKARIENMGKQNQSYLVHEFLNAGWEPLYVTDVMADFAEAKLTYVGSASLIENGVDLCVSKDLQPLVSGASDPAMRELLKDYVVNKQFRRDIYVKGSQNLTQQQQRDRLRAMTFSFASRAPMPEKYTLPVGEVTPKPQVLAAMTEAFAGRPFTGGELVDVMGKAGAREAEANILLLILVHNSQIVPLCADHATMDRAASARLNEIVLDSTAGSDSHHFLCSTGQGSAFAASFVDRLIASLVAKAPDDSDSKIAAAAFDSLASAGRAFHREGKALTKTDENIQEITKTVAEFRAQRLPVWRTFGVLA